jgi:hypothetical protein
MRGGTGFTIGALTRGYGSALSILRDCVVPLLELFGSGFAGTQVHPTRPTSSRTDLCETRPTDASNLCALPLRAPTLTWRWASNLT